MRPGWRRIGNVAATAVVCAIAWLGAAAAEPELPPGLAASPEPESSQAEPALPPGLGGSPSGGGEEPALPPGLGGEASSSEGPALPPGLGGEAASDATGPALPPGLGDASAEEAEAPSDDADARRFRLNLHGFWETRAGVRTQSDRAQSKDLILGETRLQLKTQQFWDPVRFEATGDVYLDAVLEEAVFDLRTFRFSWTPLPSLDIRVGRQVLTWGTGDMLFVNDMFPKDWESYFSGREQEYLKAPSDALRVGWYTDAANVEVVYTPQFDHDRFIRGRRISYWNPLAGGHAGSEDQVDYNAPSDWFEDDEIAVRVYRTFGAFEAAAYGYWGYWKSPGGQRLLPLGQARFPKLAVYGASLRGPVGPGIANVELGYYDSRQDRSGADPFVNNSEFRLLIGYEQELARNFTGAIQYYMEHMTDYGAYERARFFFEPKRDKNRHVVTLRLTKLLMNQNLTLSLFAYMSPSDRDAYLRPKATYKVNDHWTVEAGANVFLGASDTSFFGQFEDNSNVYAGARYSF